MCVKPFDSERKVLWLTVKSNKVEKKVVSGPPGWSILLVKHTDR